MKYGSCLYKFTFNITEHMYTLNVPQNGTVLKEVQSISKATIDNILFGVK